MQKAPRRLAPSFCLLLLSMSAAYACSEKSQVGGGASGSGGSAQAGAGAAGTSATSGGSTTVGSGGLNITGTDSGTPCETRCSVDLHDVLDCHDKVIQTCSATEGCSDGGCVSACDSASLNQSSIGCDYYSVAPTATDGAKDASCFAAFVVNTWNAPVSLEVQKAGTSLPIADIARIPKGSGSSITYTALPGGLLPPGEVAIIFLSESTSASRRSPCPAGVGVGYQGPNAELPETGIAEAFHIKSSAPISAYDIYPYGGGQSEITSATLLLPTSSWGTNYLAASAQVQNAVVSGSMLYIVAEQDQTNVTINPDNTLIAGTGVAGSAKSVPVTYQLSQGQSLQLRQPFDLTGSPIQADKPVGVWGGTACIAIPSIPCDATHQQIPPIRALGHEYAAVRYRNRYDGMEETPPWRLVGAVDGTALSYDPAPPAGAPTTLNLGQIAEFSAAGPFVVKSQDDKHPFLMFAAMTSCPQIGDGDCRGDPEIVNVVPPDQYLNSYTFFTDPTYPETDLVVVRHKATDGFKDVTLDCAGVLSGFQPIGSAGEFEYTRIDLVRGNFEKQGKCDNGRHEMKSDGEFGVTVWGWGSKITGGSPPFSPTLPGFYTQAVSYAYPAGASVKPVNQVVVPPVVK